MNPFIKFYATILTLILIFFILLGCKNNPQKSPDKYKLLLKNSVNLSVPEPSGLCFSSDKKNFWTVSDQNSTVYLISINGKTLKSFKVNLEDLEAITLIDNNKLAVIGERTREILIIDTNGVELKRNKLEIKGRPNEGIEGICYLENQKSFFFVNEKRPGLFIKTDDSFNIKLNNEITFAKDYSDICYDKDDNSLWVLSDESRKFFKVDQKGKVLEEYSIFIDQPEGIAVDAKNKKVFIVSDKTEKLYEYDLP